jgi:hypothetical protein
VQFHVLLDIEKIYLEACRTSRSYSRALLSAAIVDGIHSHYYEFAYEHPVPVSPFEEKRFASDTCKNNSNMNTEDVRKKSLLLL